MSDGKTRRRMTEREWQCFADGVNWERERVSKSLEDYLKLTKHSEEVEGSTPNPDWSNGYQAAIAITKGNRK